MTNKKIIKITNCGIPNKRLKKIFKNKVRMDVKQTALKILASKEKAGD